MPELIDLRISGGLVTVRKSAIEAVFAHEVNDGGYCYSVLTNSERYRVDSHSYKEALKVLSGDGSTATSVSHGNESVAKILVKHAEIIVDAKDVTKPYYKIRYYDMDDHEHIGYGSYELAFVVEWKNNCFEMASKVVSIQTDRERSEKET